MRFQRASYTCGPNSIANAAIALGLEVSEWHIESFCGTTEKAGTDEFGVMKGAKAIGLNPRPFQFNNGLAAWLWLIGCLNRGVPVMLCVESCDHWVTAIGACGGSVIIANGEQSYKNQQENGIAVWDKDELIKQWEYCENADGDKQFYGIGVSL